MSTVTNVVTAEYGSEEKVLRLTEPLEGVRDGEKVRVQVQTLAPETSGDPARPWMEFRGVMSGEAGESFARAIEEMFPIEK
jgi:hypothetical protein